MNKTEKNIPTIMTEANINKIERDVDYLTTIFSAIPNEKAQEKIRTIKNLEAKIDFMDENEDISSKWEKTLCILEQLRVLKELSIFLDLVVESNLERNQQSVLINLVTVYSNANSLAFRTHFATYDDEKQNILAKPIETYAVFVTDFVIDLFKKFANEIPSEEDCEKLLKRVYSLNGSIIQFCELGF